MSDPSPAEPRADTPDVLQQTWQALTAGQIVALPTGSGYVLAAHVRHPDAVARLAEARARAGTPLFLAVRGAAEARALLPTLSPVALRLARRGWPGALVLQVPDAAAFLVGVEPAVRTALSPDGAVRLGLPASDLLIHLLPVLAAPVALLAVPEPPAGTPDDQCTGAARLAALGLAADVLAEEGPRPPRAGFTVVEVRGDAWEVVAAGAVAKEQIADRLGCLVVFVCTGNTCRSPLAEALFKKRLADRLGCAVGELPRRGFFVLSAGLAAMMGQGAAEAAVAVAHEFEADLAGHASRPLTEDLAVQADFLLAMTRSHLLALDDAYPYLGCTPRLVCPDGGDVADPIGQSEAVYRDCARQIWDALDALLAEVASAPPVAAEREGVS